MHKSALVICLCAALVLVYASPAAIAQTETFTFNAASGTGVWPNHLNWDGPANKYPEVGDIAYIPDGYTCIIDDTSEEDLVDRR